MNENAPHPPEPIEPIVKWLFYIVIFLVLCMIGVERWAPSDEKVFQALYTTLAGFSGALIGRINPSSKKDAAPPLPPGTTATTSTIHVDTTPSAAPAVDSGNL